MQDPILLFATAATMLATVTILALTGLRGWTGWLALRRLELEQRQPAPSMISTNPGARIELADLKERVRKLEAIAAGVDL
jgi:hypothetical protein